MAVDYFLEIFGGTGAVILGIGTCIWGFLKSHECKCNYKDEKLDPTDVLEKDWETKGDEFPETEKNIELKEEDEEDESKVDKWTHYNRLIFAKKENCNWEINIPKGHGTVFIHTSIDRQPPSYNNKMHYLRINIKNVKKGMKIKFQQKHFDEMCMEGATMHKNIEKNITKDGVHIFETACLVGENQGRNVIFEQLGVFISGDEQEIKNVIIDEAYYGEKWSFYKIFCCKKHCKTILCRKKKNNN